MDIHGHSLLTEEQSSGLYLRVRGYAVFARRGTGARPVSPASLLPRPRRTREGCQRHLAVHAALRITTFPPSGCFIQSTNPFSAESNACLCSSMPGFCSHLGHSLGAHWLRIPDGVNAFLRGCAITSFILSMNLPPHTYLRDMYLYIYLRTASES